MHRSARPGSSSADHGGLTLVELLVTLVILSILATAALPYAEVAVRRDKEIELRRALRDLRSAIDTFHDDWNGGKISRTSGSDDGYPKSLQVLIDGADSGDAKGSRRKYLRRVPAIPSPNRRSLPAEQWVLRAYQDAADSLVWGERNVYDVRSASDGVALNGAHYADW